MALCMLCGGKSGPDHEKGIEHQRAQARLVVHVVDSMGLCPYCPPITKFKECIERDHAEKIAYCATLIYAKESDL